MQVDYLIVGAGAVGLAFLDTLFSETDATFAIVDRRDAPGGHWNDAYPYVRLHQSSSFYGVPSRPLGRGRICDHGYNAGMPELATKYEILHYYQDLMETVYLPSGRVQYFPMSEHLGNGRIRSTVSGQETRVNIAKKLVNAGIWGDLTTIPSTHKRSFDVARDVTCVPPNDLPRRASDFDAFTILGAGKTAMDAVLWLLEKGVAPEQISWVRPNDYWLFHRDNIMPHKDFFMRSMSAQVKEMEALAYAPKVRDYCLGMENSGRWHRIDPDVWPTKFHAAVCSGAEVDALRTIKDVIRAGHVRQIKSDRLVLEKGEVAVSQPRLYVDCTAQGGAILPDDSPPVFDADTINLFMVRPFQPLFSAALIAWLEAHEPNEDIRKGCTLVTNFHNTPAEFLPNQLKGFANQAMWNQMPELKAWLDRCRLNAATHMMEGLKPDDTEKFALLSQLGPLTKEAMTNIPRMLAAEV